MTNGYFRNHPDDYDPKDHKTWLLEYKTTDYGSYCKVYSMGERPAIWRYRDGVGDYPSIEMPEECCEDLDDFESQVNLKIAEYIRDQARLRRNAQKDLLKIYEKELDDYMALPYLFRLIIAPPDKNDYLY